VPAIRTEITEIVTGLAMLGYQDVQRALEVRPRHITHVDEPVFERLDQSWASGAYASDFAIAWENGYAFARSDLGLRGRPPWTLEWKGHHKPGSKAIETIPADLRVDHVYLVSCKYRSRILHNAGPLALFEHLLAPSGPVTRLDWFERIAGDAFRPVWEPVYQRAGLPPTVTPGRTSQAQRERVKQALVDQPIDTSSPEYRSFVAACSENSAAYWRARLTTPQLRSEMYWRMLRMQSAPYFVLGARDDATPLRYRIDTPWDFNRRYAVRLFDITPGGRGQPSVDWQAVVRDDVGDIDRVVDGHVEVRWAHGKLNAAPEAKVYLDTDPVLVPGYEPL
jgi:hypothetical protein